MALARGALLTVYFATLFYDKTPAPAVAFNLPLGEARSQQFFKRSSMVFSQSLSMESEPRQDSSPKYVCLQVYPFTSHKLYLVRRGHFHIRFLHLCCQSSSIPSRCRE